MSGAPELCPTCGRTAEQWGYCSSAFHIPAPAVSASGAAVPTSGTDSHGGKGGRSGELVALIASLQAECVRLREERDGLREDAKRLDWLQRHPLKHPIAQDTHGWQVLTNNAEEDIEWLLTRLAARSAVSADRELLRDAAACIRAYGVLVVAARDRREQIRGIAERLEALADV